MSKSRYTVSIHDEHGHLVAAQEVDAFDIHYGYREAPLDIQKVVERNAVKVMTSAHQAAVAILLVNNGGFIKSSGSVS